MRRLLFGRGAEGALIAELQSGLFRRGFDPKGADGIFGRDTVHAVEAFQRDAGSAVTGSVSDEEWVTLTERPVPDLEARCLQVTAAFEGHSYTLVQGNWDNAWLTWGIIGFTLKHGEIQHIVRAVWNRAPHLIDDAFGSDADELLRIMEATPAEQEAWANSISRGARVVEPWRSGFERFGRFPEVQQEQAVRAHTAYYVPALATVERLELITERAVALCFDTQVQNGGVKPAIEAALMAMAASPELERLETLAAGVANTALPEFRDDVRSRRMAIARGEGMVHGRPVVLAHWGIALVPAV